MTIFQFFQEFQLPFWGWALLIFITWIRVITI
jgi:hypothetical protein